MGVLEALEALWGLGPTLAPRRAPGMAVVRRPWGFTVVEAGPRPRPAGGWLVYLARSVGLDSRAAASRLARALGAGEYSLAGLKDACSVSYQYVSLRLPRGVPRGPVRLPGVEAWPVGRGLLAPGRHSGNTFRLLVEHPDPNALCSALASVSRVPGYYGPQRFGVERPNSHYAGLLRLLGLRGSLLREYARRYPLEGPSLVAPRGPGRLEGARDAASPWAPGDGWEAEIHLDALRAYLFNRALARALERGGPEAYAEHWLQLPCPGGRSTRAPAARLPGAWRGRSAWARLVWEVAEEEGLAGALGLLRGRPFRPLAFPLCRLHCRPAGGRAVVVLQLPPGAYATIALREAAPVDWMAYAECRAHRQPT